MNIAMIIYLLGSLMEVEAALMLFPAAIGLGYGEKSAYAFLVIAAAEALLGFLIIRKKPRKNTFFARDVLL